MESLLSGPSSIDPKAMTCQQAKSDPGHMTSRGCYSSMLAVTNADFRRWLALRCGAQLPEGSGKRCCTQVLDHTPVPCNGPGPEADKLDRGGCGQFPSAELFSVGRSRYVCEPVWPYHLFDHRTRAIRSDKVRQVETHQCEDMQSRIL